MACEDYERAIVEYIDGELASENSRELEKHIEKCQACKEFYQDIKRLKECLMLHYPRENFTAKVMAQIRREHRARENWISIVLFLMLSISYLAQLPFKLINFINGTQELIAIMSNMTTSLKEVYTAGDKLLQLLTDIAYIIQGIFLLLFNAMPWGIVFFTVVLLFAPLYLLSRYLAPRV